MQRQKNYFVPGKVKERRTIDEGGKQSRGIKITKVGHSGMKKRSVLLQRRKIKSCVFEGTKKKKRKYLVYKE